MSVDLAARALAQRALKAVGDTQGADAYEVAVASGFIGSRSAWLASLRGPPGAGEPGLDAYAVAVDAGFVGNRTAWLASLKGTPGVGEPGKDAYAVAVEAGFSGDRAAWLVSLQGPPGADADPTDLANLQTQLGEALERLAVLESPDTLGPLALSANEVSEETPPGTPIGTVIGLHPYEVVSQVSSSEQLVYNDGQVFAGPAGFDYDTASSIDLTIDRLLTKPGRAPVEISSTLTVQVIGPDVPPVVEVRVSLPQTGTTDLNLGDYLVAADGVHLTLVLPGDCPPLRYIPA